MNLAFFLLALLPLASSEPKINVKELKCLVCRRLVEELEKEIDKIDPKKTVEIGHFRLNHEGDIDQKRVEYRKSEVYLTELMEKICDKMEDFVRARTKTTGKLVVIPLIEDGKMNPDIGNLDLIQDSDLNKSLKFYCENILGENEEGFIKMLSKDNDNLDIKLCTEVASLCNQTIDEDYNFENHEEL